MSLTQLLFTHAFLPTRDTFINEYKSLYVEKKKSEKKKNQKKSVKVCD